MLPFSLTLVQKSATKMREELAELLEIFHKVEEAGGKATISITTSLGVTKTKLEIVSPTPGSSISTSSSSPPAPGNQAAGRRRRRHRGARASARRNQRAAAHQASLAEAATSVPLDPPRPLQLHPSPPLASGRRQVITVARPEVPTFPTLNVDGPSSPPPAAPPPLFNCDICGQKFPTQDGLNTHKGAIEFCHNCLQARIHSDPRTPCPCWEPDPVGN